jgi:hypothetical protein
MTTMAISTRINVLDQTLSILFGEETARGNLASFQC